MDESSIFVGQEYLRRFPHQRNVKALCELIVGRGVESQRHDLVDNDPLRSLVRSRIRNDFFAGSTLQMEGWILALTEVRIMALHALLTNMG